MTSPERTPLLQQRPLRPLRQKTIGILGGMTDQATIEYYRLLNQRLNQRLGGWDIGEIVIVSVNFGNIEAWLREGAWEEISKYLGSKLDALERSGADVILCASNTLHRVVAPLMAARPTPFLHVADITGAAIQRAGLTRVALLGTRATMRWTELADYFQSAFGVETLVPDDPDADRINHIVFHELARRDLRPESRADFLRIIDKLRADGAQGVILGCTEIFLLVNQDHLPGFPVFDTTSLHVDAAIAFASEA